ncbi:MAG: hypothetical protein GC131_05210 [Alphaproteobacteria bacterium]|nr:hypothetical protein [Alphaproteobacteria bacterium]
MSGEKKVKPVLEETEGSRYYGVALDIVGALGDAGFSLLPLEPSQAMQREGARVGGVSPQTAYKIYRAMCSSASGEWGGTLEDPFALFDYLLKGGQAH